jgi:hypothetical protein
MASMGSPLLAALAVAAGLPAVFAFAPAQAAPCLGNNTFSGTTPGSGANCGTLVVGENFSIDVTSYFAPLLLGPSPTRAVFTGTPFAIGIVKGDGAGLSFSNVQARFTGRASSFEFINAPIAFWAGDNTVGFGTGPNGSFGSAPSGGFPTVNYLATIQSNSFAQDFDAYQQAAFSFGSAVGGFRSGGTSPSTFSIQRVDRFIVEGTLTGSTNQASTQIGFGFTPTSFPTGVVPVGGYYTVPVPGPLPLAGAGMAFAWSPTLRRRIRAAR